MTNGTVARSGLLACVALTGLMVVLWGFRPRSPLQSLDSSPPAQAEASQLRHHPRPDRLP